MKSGKNSVQKEMQEDSIQKETNEQAIVSEEQLPPMQVDYDKYLRLVAEFDNYRKRTSRERLDLIKTAGEELIQGILPVLDDFKMAMDTLSNATDIQAVVDGIDLIYRKLYKYLETNGLKSIEAMGVPLDTDRHEAVAQSPIEDPELKGTIIDVLQQGYTLHGKVIRYAKVVVGV